MKQHYYIRRMKNIGDFRELFAAVSVPSHPGEHNPLSVHSMEDLHQLMEAGPERSSQYDVDINGAPVMALYSTDNAVLFRVMPSMRKNRASTSTLQDRDLLYRFAEDLEWQLRSSLKEVS